MVQKKQTNIRQDFFPSGENYATADAETSAIAQDGGPGAAGSSAPAGRTATDSRRPSFAQRLGKPPLKSFRKDARSVPSSAVAQNDQPNAFEKDKIILVDWDGDDDPENPLNWSPSKKWANTSLLCVMCLCIGLATAAFSPGIPQMTEELGAPLELGQLGLALFNFAFAFVPMFLGPLSEFVGTQPVYLVCYGCFVLFFLPIALAKNIGTVLAGRVLSGIAGAMGVTVIPASLTNIWAKHERGFPTALFTFVAVFGTVASPLYAGYVVANPRLGWRWNQWIQMIINGGIFLLELVFLREAKGSVLLTRKAKKLRKESGDNRYRAAAELETPNLKALLQASTTRAAMLLVKEPVVLFFSAWLAYSWSLIFAFFTAIGIAFEEYRGWEVGNSGLAYLGPIIGCFLAFGFLFHDNHLYAEAQRKNNGIPVPEARLYYGAIGGILCPAGMFIFSFSGSYTWVHWIVPEIGLVLVLCGISFIFNCVQIYLSDSYGTEYGASAISAQGFVRNAMAASFPLFTAQMFHNLGFQYAGLLLSMLITIAIPLPFVLIKYGERIRARSKYAAAQTGISGEEGAGGPVIYARRDVETARKSKPVDLDSAPTSGAVTRVATPEEDAAKKAEEGVQP